VTVKPWLPWLLWYHLDAEVGMKAGTKVRVVVGTFYEPIDAITTDNLFAQCFPRIIGLNSPKDIRKSRIVCH
jgi:hypothetical protein